MSSMVRDHLGRGLVRPLERDDVGHLLVQVHAGLAGALGVDLADDVALDLHPPVDDSARPHRGRPPTGGTSGPARRPRFARSAIRSAFVPSLAPTSAPSSATARSAGAVISIRMFDAVTSSGGGGPKNSPPGTPQVGLPLGVRGVDGRGQVRGDLVQPGGVARQGRVQRLQRRGQLAGRRGNGRVRAVGPLDPDQVVGLGVGQLTDRRTAAAVAARCCRRPAMSRRAARRPSRPGAAVAVAPANSASFITATSRLSASSLAGWPLLELATTDRFSSATVRAVALISSTRVPNCSCVVSHTDESWPAVSRMVSATIVPRAISAVRVALSFGLFARSLKADQSSASCACNAVSLGSANACSIRPSACCWPWRYGALGVLDAAAALQERVPEPLDALDLDAVAHGAGLGVQAGHRRAADLAQLDPLAGVSLGVGVGDVLRRDLHAALVRVQRGQRGRDSPETYSCHTAWSRSRVRGAPATVSPRRP